MELDDPYAASEKDPFVDKMEPGDVRRNKVTSDVTLEGVEEDDEQTNNAVSQRLRSPLEEKDIAGTGNAVTVCLCYNFYKRTLRRMLSGINMFYYHLGKNVAKRPKCWILAMLIFVGICCSGFARFQTENRTELLYVPDDSESEKILSKTRPYFKTYQDIREEEMIFRAKNGENVMVAACLKEAESILSEVLKIKGYQALCMPKPDYIFQYQQYDVTMNCSVLNPLEMIQNFSQAMRELNVAFSNKQILMSNGRIPFFNKPEIIAKVRQKGSEMEQIGAMRIVLHMQPLERVKDWEEQFLNILKRKAPALKCASVVYSAQRSIDDVITESSSADVNLVTVSFALMIVFACTTIGKVRNPVRGHALLAYFGIFSTSLGIASGMGLVLLMGYPYLSIVGILIFLTLSIGVDDMFIILDEYDKLVEEQDSVERIGKTMYKVGATITLTTFTNIVAFGISCLSTFPAIRVFCIFAATTFAVEFILQVTIFVAFLAFDARRIQASRRDCLPCSHAKDENSCLPHVQDSFASLVMEKYARIVVKWPTKLIIFALSIATLAGSIYGCFHVSEEFSRTTLVPDGSYYLHYINVLENEFELSLGIDLVKLGTDNYSSPVVQSEIDGAAEAATSTNYYLPHHVSWLETYKNWADFMGLDINGKNFTKHLQTFLSLPSFAHFRGDLHFNLEDKIEASRTHVFFKPIWRSTFLRDAMINTRKEFRQRGLTVIPITGLFMHFEQFAAVVSEVTRNVCLTATSVLIMSLPFCISPVVVLLLFFSFILLITNLVGLMYLWDISVNGISMMNLVVSVGFAVDYSAHVAFAFVTSKERTSDARVVDALSGVGASVLMGGMSTFTGMLITFLGSSEIFRIFFRMLFGIVVISLYHGLVLLPALFSTFGFLV